MMSMRHEQPRPDSNEAERSAPPESIFQRWFYNPTPHIMDWIRYGVLFFGLGYLVVALARPRPQSIHRQLIVTDMKVYFWLFMLSITLGLIAAAIKSWGEGKITKFMQEKTPETSGLEATVFTPYSPAAAEAVDSDEAKAQSDESSSKRE